MKAFTKKTLDWLRAQGYEADVVERWVPHGDGVEVSDGAGRTRRTRPGIHRDLFGVFDVVGVRLGRVGVALVQCTGYSSMAARVQKVRASWPAYLAVQAGNRVVVVGWKKSSWRGRESWQPVVREVSLADFNPPPGRST